MIIRNAYKAEGDTTRMSVFSKKYGEVVFLIDSEDAPRVKCFHWLVSNRDSRAVAAIGEGKIFLHRLITSFEHPIIDHTNRNTLDNRKANLRPATASQNCRNSSIPKNNTSGFKGVSFHRLRNIYQAHIRVNLKSVFLGNFLTPIDAAKAYNDAAILHHGEFASLNNIPTNITYASRITRPRHYKGKHR